MKKHSDQSSETNENPSWVSRVINKFRGETTNAISNPSGEAGTAWAKNQNANNVWDVITVDSVMAHDFLAKIQILSKGMDPDYLYKCLHYIATFDEMTSLDFLTDFVDYVHILGKDKARTILFDSLDQFAEHIEYVLTIFGNDHELFISDEEFEDLVIRASRSPRAGSFFLNHPEDWKLFILESKKRNDVEWYVLVSKYPTLKYLLVSEIPPESKELDNLRSKFDIQDESNIPPEPLYHLKLILNFADDIIKERALNKMNWIEDDLEAIDDKSEDELELIHKYVKQEQISMKRVLYSFCSDVLIRTFASQQKGSNGELHWLTNAS